MPLNTIPVLPKDHPLYDWADYQSSRDALVKGTPTKQFAKEAWNAIVDSLSEALAVAGLEWDDTYTTAEGARITTSPGKLTAVAFNSVRLNIDRPAPLGWQWAWNESFRGYLGREEFRGVSTHGRARDKVYPEYIVELARKLNLLLEIMRETALLSEAEAAQISGLTIHAEATAGKSAPVDVEHISTVNINADGTSAPGSPGEVEKIIATKVYADGTTGMVSTSPVRLKIPLQLYVEGHIREALSMEPNPLLMGTKIHAEMESTRCTETAAERSSASSAWAEVERIPTLPTEAEGMSRTTCEAEVLQREALPAEAQARVPCLVAADADIKKSAPMAARSLLLVRVSADADRLKAMPTESTRLSGLRVYCEVDTAWYPPIWVNGGLWIRQSHSVTPNENGELVIK